MSVLSSYRQSYHLIAAGYAGYTVSRDNGIAVGIYYPAEAKEDF